MLMDDESTNARPSLPRPDRPHVIAGGISEARRVGDLLLMVAQGYLDLDDVTKARCHHRGLAKKGSGDAKEQAQSLLKKLEPAGQAVRS